jgi:hypothetical protein
MCYKQINMIKEFLNHVVAHVLDKSVTKRVYYNVMYTHVAKWWLGKQPPLLGHARNTHATIERGYATVSEHLIGKDASITIVFVQNDVFYSVREKWL